MAVAKLSAKLLARKGAAMPSAYQPAIARLVERDERFTFLTKTATQASSQASYQGRRVKKTVKLEAALNRKLCLLSARLGMSQQKLMEKAVLSLIEQAQADDSCICLMD
ncbi:MAG: hypothetical protein JKY34_13125 [Kordiimonadaceae bacterium]|nr:hypothetical protein [Kordiimonadaceae bacterium]